MVFRIGLLWFRGLRVGQWIEPCIGLTQENSIENAIQNCLPYILKAYGPCYILLAYPKQLCVLRSQEVDLVFYYFLLLFWFWFWFNFIYFLFIRT